MTDRKQARAMDLPGYPCPPFVRDIPTHTGSWGWVATDHIAQDDTGHLWADGTVHPKPTPETIDRGMWAHRSLVAWSEDGLTVWANPRAHGIINRIEGVVDESRWVPIALVMTKLPDYAAGRRDN